MHVSLKIKIFHYWFLKKEVVTKDNIATMNQYGSKTCCFLANLKLSRLVFLLSLCNFLWRGVFVLFGIKPLRNTNHLFNNQLKLGGCKHNYLSLMTRAATIFSAIWITRNDVVFHKRQPKNFYRFHLGRHTSYDFGLYCSAWMKARNRFFMLESYQNLRAMQLFIYRL